MAPRIPIVLAVTLAAIAFAGAPAAAHVRAVEASNLSSEITVLPETEGATWRIYAGGELISLRNDGPTTIVVHGYEGEPFLRVGPDGVHENRNSPATYLNSDRYADVALPPRADPDAPAEWRLVSTGADHVWHDHRTHWMSPELPAAVRQEPRQHHHISDWTIPLTIDGAPAEVRGELGWVPLERRAWWWAGLVLGLLVALSAGWRVRSPVRVAAVAVGAVAGANVIHLIDEFVARPQHWLDVIGGFLHTGLFVALGLTAAIWVLRGQDGPRLALGIGAGGIAFHQGALQLGLMDATSVDTIWPLVLLRLLVVASLASAMFTFVVIARTRSSVEEGPPSEGSFDPPDRGRVPVGAG